MIYAGQDDYYNGVGYNYWYDAVTQTVATVVKTFVREGNATRLANSTTIHLPKNETFTSYGTYVPGQVLQPVTISGVPTNLVPNDNTDYAASAFDNVTTRAFPYTDIVVTYPTPFDEFSGISLFQGWECPQYPEPAFEGENFALADKYLQVNVSRAHWSEGEFATKNINLPTGIKTWLAQQPGILQKYPFITDCMLQTAQGEPTVHIPVTQLTVLSTTIIDGAVSTSPKPASSLSTVTSTTSHAGTTSVQISDTPQSSVSSTASHIETTSAQQSTTSPSRAASPTTSRIDTTITQELSTVQSPPTSSTTLQSPPVPGTTSDAASATPINSPPGNSPNSETTQSTASPSEGTTSFQPLPSPATSALLTPPEATTTPQNSPILGTASKSSLPEATNTPPTNSVPGTSDSASPSQGTTTQQSPPNPVASAEDTSQSVVSATLVGSSTSTATDQSSHIQPSQNESDSPASSSVTSSRTPVSVAQTVGNQPSQNPSGTSVSTSTARGASTSSMVSVADSTINNAGTTDADGVVSSEIGPEETPAASSGNGNGGGAAASVTTTEVDGSSGASAGVTGGQHSEGPSVPSGTTADAGAGNGGVFESSLFLGSTTLSAGGAALTSSGTTYSALSSGSGIIVAASGTTSTFASNGAAGDASTNPFVVGSQTLSAGGNPTVTQGTTYSALPSGSGVAIVAGGSTSVFNGDGAVGPSSSAPFIIGGQTVSAGGSAIVTDGTTFSMLPSNSGVVVAASGQTSTMFAAGTKVAVSGPPFEQASSAYTFNGQTIGLSSVITAQGTTYSALPSGSGVVVAANGETSTLSGGSSLSASTAASGAYVIAGQTISAGGAAVTADGTAFSALPSDSGIIVIASGGTSTLAAGDAYVVPTYAPSGYVVSGQTASPGGAPITADGTTYSVLTSGSDVIVVAGGQTSTLAAGGASAALTQGSTGYIVEGQTLTPGGTSIVIAGTTYSALSSSSGIVAAANGETNTIQSPDQGGDGITLGGGGIIATPVSLPSSTVASIITLASHSYAYQAQGTNAVILGSQTLSVSGPGVTENGETLSLISKSGTLVAVVDETITTALPTALLTSLPTVVLGTQLLTIGSQTLTVSAATGATEGIVIGSTTIYSGSTAVIDGETVALTGSDLVIVSSSSTVTEGLGSISGSRVSVAETGDSNTLGAAGVSAPTTTSSTASAVRTQSLLPACNLVIIAAFVVWIITLQCG